VSSFECSRLGTRWHCGSITASLSSTQCPSASGSRPTPCDRPALALALCVVMQRSWLTKRRCTLWTLGAPQYGRSTAGEAAVGIPCGWAVARGAHAPTMGCAACCSARPAADACIPVPSAYLAVSFRYDVCTRTLECARSRRPLSVRVHGIGYQRWAAPPHNVQRAACDDQRYTGPTYNIPVTCSSVRRADRCDHALRGERRAVVQREAECGGHARWAAGLEVSGGVIVRGKHRLHSEHLGAAHHLGQPVPASE
jgi:hypothetical protein